MNKNILIIGAILILLVVVLFIQKINQNKLPEVVKIGFIGPLTGDVAFIG
jgi:hypothetical protein